MESFTPEQQKNLDSWASKRDAILIEIAHEKIEYETLSKLNKDLASSNTEIADKIQQSIGRLEELIKKEKDRALLIVPEIADLSSEKSVLQVQVSSLNKEVTALTNTKSTITEDIKILMELKTILLDSRNFIDMITDKVTTSVSADMKQMDEFVKSLTIAIQNILELSTQNISAHTAVLDQIPKLFVEMKRKSLDREIINKHK